MTNQEPDSIYANDGPALIQLVVSLNLVDSLNLSSVAHDNVVIHSEIPQ